MTPLQAAWVDLMGRKPWHDFGTFTFDRGRFIHPEALNKKMALLYARYGEEYFGRRAYRDMAPIAFVYCVEAHKDGRSHMHSLAFHPYWTADDGDRRKLCMSLWDHGKYAHTKSLREGIARVGLCDDQAAREYLAKSYVSKDAHRGEVYIPDSGAAYLGERDLVIGPEAFTRYFGKHPALCRVPRKA